MSREIAPKASVTFTAEETAMVKTEDAKLIFTTYRDRLCALTIHHNRLIDAAFLQNTVSKVGAIYIGKIKNIVKNMNSCFVEISDGEMCFLSMENVSVPYLVNRKFDGRILEGDELLVQIIRDAQKGKRASVTANISLSNDFFVIMLGSEKVGFSQKLEKEKRHSLKKALTSKGILKNGCLTQEVKTLLSASDYDNFISEGMALDILEFPPLGAIVRTMAAVEQGTETELLEHIVKEFYSLSAQLFRLLYIAQSRSCFSCLKKPPLAFETIVRQFLTAIPIDMECPSLEEHLTDHEQSRKDLCVVEREQWIEGKREFITDNKSLYQQLTEYCVLHKDTYKDLSIRLYQDSMLSLSMLYSVEKKLDTALHKNVWLKSGGYLVIEPTEALTVIDVNSGKMEKKYSMEKAYLRINMEAAWEIALQLRVRNLSGIIIVDFINMESIKDKKELLDYLKALVKRDAIPTTVVDMTPLGLVEITRKKVNKPLREQFMSEDEMNLHK